MSISYYGCPCPDLKRPYSKMADAKSTIDAHVGCNRVLYVTNGEEQLKYESVRGFVGTKNWTIIHSLEESDRIKHLEDKFNEMQGAFSKMQDEIDEMQDEIDDIGGITMVPFVKNAAAQVLLRLIGEQPKLPTPVSTRFRCSTGKVKIRIESCAKELQFSSEKFIKTSDKILNRRNDTVHPANDSDLIEMVSNASRMLKKYPKLRRTCREEFEIIEEFASISTFFPSMPVA